MVAGWQQVQNPSVFADGRTYCGGSGLVRLVALAERRTADTPGLLFRRLHARGGCLQ